MATCILIRHGRSSANTDGILAGWMPEVHLDDTGQEQALRLAERLAHLPIVTLATSPLDRCRETLAPLADRLGIVLEVHEGLAECRYGSWTGRPLRDLAEDPLWRIVQDDPCSARFPDSPQYPGESLPEMAERALAAVAEIDAAVTAAHGDHSIWALASHGDVIKAILADLLGAGLTHFQRLQIDPASVSIVRLGEGRAMIMRMGDTGTIPAPATDPGPPVRDGVVGGGAG